MANSNKLNISEFDFEEVRENLRTFLEGQPEFSDYNFEGSGFAVLLDLLAYNTHYLGFNANMLANEIYLDSADIRKNIVSLAKMLGYTPASVRAPIANLNVTINDATTPTVALPRGTSFLSTINDVNYTFVTIDDRTITPVDGVYRFEGVDVYEGTLINYNFTVDANDPDQRFIIPSEFADTRTLRVQVQSSATDTELVTYSLANGVTNLQPDSKIYFLQETDQDRFEIYFGDNVLGQQLQTGNIVRISYVVTNRAASNGANIFTRGANSISGSSNVTITTNTSASGGTERESKESIRFNAPLHYATQNRAVTTSDYEVLTRQIYPNAQVVSAWGGEDDEIPVYGIVNISIKPRTGSTLTQRTKQSIISQLKQYNVASVVPRIVDPETTFINLTSNVKYDSTRTTKSTATIRTEILDEIRNYNTNELSTFDEVFRYSKLTGLIDDTDNSILSNITTLSISKTFEPTLNTSLRYNVYFRNALYNPNTGYNAVNGGILTSTGFFLRGETNEFFLNDDGEGNVRRYHYENGIVTYDNVTQGTINYDTGAIVLSSLSISSLSQVNNQDVTSLRITVEPRSNDIVPVRNQLLEIDFNTIRVFVTPDEITSGEADAGIGYNTSRSR